MSVIIGIDPSINSTGICVWDNEHNINKYYNIVSKVTKKLQSFESSHIKILSYNKSDIKDKEYSYKELAKTSNIYYICKHIRNILTILRPKSVIMEGVSYGSVGSAALVDLSGLNFAIRMVLADLEIPFKIVPPTAVKKFATGNGQADKELIIDAWKRLDKNMLNIKDIKVDDLADSFFLAHYQSET